MIKFNELLERVKSERIAVHTPTEKQAKTLLEALNEKGYKWLTGDKLTDITRYEYYGKNTCYDFGIDIAGDLLNKEVVYSPLGFYQGADYTIIKFTDIDFEEE